MKCYPCTHIMFDVIIDFWMPFSFFFFVHRVVTNFMALCFGFAAIIRRFAVFGLISNMLVKRHSDLLALGFLTGVDIIGTLGILSVTPSGFYTIAAYRISLNLCWSSHLTACWYILFMLFILLCSKEDLVHNDWSIPIVGAIPKYFEIF